MTPADAHFLNTVREIMGQAPIPGIGPGERRLDVNERDLRFIANLAQYEGDGNRRAPRKAGAL
jgi:hypothetical protein